MYQIRNPRGLFFIRITIGYWVFVVLHISIMRHSEISFCICLLQKASYCTRRNWRASISTELNALRGQRLVLSFCIDVVVTLSIWVEYIRHFIAILHTSPHANRGWLYNYMRCKNILGGNITVAVDCFSGNVPLCDYTKTRELDEYQISRDNVKTYGTVSMIWWYIWYNILIDISITISLAFLPIFLTLSLCSLLPHFKSMRCHILLDRVRTASYYRHLSSFIADFPLTEQPHHQSPMTSMISMCQWCARLNKVGYMKMVELPVIWNEDLLMCHVTCSRINMFEVQLYVRKKLIWQMVQ